MERLILFLNVLLFSLGFAAAFVNFEADKEYNFLFKSKFVLAPAALGGGQNVQATMVVRKLNANNLIIRIKDSTFTGANVHSKSLTDIEGVIGIKRNPGDGSITHVISKSTRGMEILCKKMMVDMLSDDLSFFKTFAKNYETMKTMVQHDVKFSAGQCSAEVRAFADHQKHLTQVLASAPKSDCEVNNVILMAGQVLLHGTTTPIGQVMDDSNFGMSVFFDSRNGKIKEVSKFTFMNLKVGGFDVQARHNMVMQFISEQPSSQETEFSEPYHIYTKDEIDQFVINYRR